MQEDTVETPAEDSVSGRFDDATSWCYDAASGTFYFEGTGAVPENFPEKESGPWKQRIAEAQEIVIAEKITYVSSSILYYCDALERLTLPTCCIYPTENEYYSTRGWRALSSFFNSSKEIHKKLTDVTILGGEKIPKCFFEGCSAMKTVKLPDSVTVIEDSAFSGCKALEEIVWPKTLQKIDSNAFANCTAISLSRCPKRSQRSEKAAFTAARR